MFFTDHDECASANDNNCDSNATCTNTPGSFTCACNSGYSGDGLICAGKFDCTTKMDISMLFQLLIG